MKIQIYGPIDGPTGYDEITRNLIAGLYFYGESVEIKPYVGWSPFTVQHNYRELFETIQSRKDSRPIDININMCLPCQAQPLGHAVNILYSMFEADRIPDSWAESANVMDKIIVPTEFCKKAWVQSGVSLCKLAVVNIGLDTQRYNPGIKPVEIYRDGSYLPISNYKYRFLHIQEFVSRKNLDGLLKAWEIATNDPAFPVKDACLILKVNGYSGSKMKSLSSTLKQYSPKAPIYLYSRIIADGALPGLYALATHYITMTYGEGWGLSEHKAGMLGKVVIAPNSTSFPTFLDKDTAYLVPTAKVPAAQEGATAPFYEGALWYEPNVAAAAKAIVESVNDTVRGPKLAEKLAKDFNIQRFISEMRAVCTAALKPQPLVKIVENKEPKVLHYCRSMGTECGIGNYTHGLYNALQVNYGDKKLSQMMLGGPDFTIEKTLDENKVTACHVHLEYQFMSPQRLEYLAHLLHTRGISLIVTMHTVNKDAIMYHKVLSNYADIIVVQSQAMKDEYLRWGGWIRNPDDIKVIPLACDTTGVCNNMFSPGERRFSVGFFGFTYFHKGLDKLLMAIAALKGQDKRKFILRAFSRKPVQDAVKYAEHCKWLLTNLGVKEQVLWNEEYLEEAKLVQYLSACNVVVLPYSDYGGVGVSAAIRTVMKSGTPIITSDSCFFSDIPEALAPKVHDLETLPDVLVQYANTHSVQVVEEYTKRRDAFLAANSFKVIASKYMDLYTGK